MYEKVSVKKVFVFLAGAILFAAVVAPLSMQLFIHATNFAVSPNSEIGSDPVLPMQFIVLSPLAGIALGCVFGTMWGWILARFSKKNSTEQSNKSALRLCIGVLLFLPLLVYVFLPRVWDWAKDLIPWGMSFVLAAFWLSGLGCYVLWILQERFSGQNPIKTMRFPKIQKHLPLIFLILLFCSVAVGMIFQVYPVSTSFIYLLQGSELYHLFPDPDSMVRFKAYAFNMPAGIHPAVVAVVAFLLCGWRMIGKKTS